MGFKNIVNEKVKLIMVDGRGGGRKGDRHSKDCACSFLALSHAQSIRISRLHVIMVREDKDFMAWTWVTGWVCVPSGEAESGAENMHYQQNIYNQLSTRALVLKKREKIISGGGETKHKAMGWHFMVIVSAIL